MGIPDSDCPGAIVVVDSVAEAATSVPCAFATSSTRIRFPASNINGNRNQQRLFHDRSLLGQGRKDAANSAVQSAAAHGRGPDAGISWFLPQAQQHFRVFGGGVAVGAGRFVVAEPLGAFVEILHDPPGQWIEPMHQRHESRPRRFSKDRRGESAPVHAEESRGVVGLPEFPTVAAAQAFERHAAATPRAGRCFQ